MTTWILILTLSTWDGVSVATAKFDNEVACRSAAVAWLATKTRGNNRPDNKDAQCHPTIK